VSWLSLRGEIEARDEGALRARATAWIEGLPEGRARMGWRDAVEELGLRWELCVYATLCALATVPGAPPGEGWLKAARERTRAHLVAVTNPRGLRMMEHGVVRGETVRARFVCDEGWAREGGGESVRALIRWATYNQEAPVDPAPEDGEVAAGAAAAGVHEEDDGAHVGAEGDAGGAAEGGDEVGVEDRALVAHHLGRELTSFRVAVAAVEPRDEVGAGGVVLPGWGDAGDAWAAELPLL